MYFFTADMHIGHNNIISHCNRPFENEIEMTSEIINRHNEVVSPNDDIFDLGDVGYRCTSQYLVKQLEKMNGRRHILLGNHDKPIRQAFVSGLLDDMIGSGKISFIGFKNPHTCRNIINDPDLSVIRDITIEDQNIVVSHYALRTWKGAFRGTWHLYGHSHTNLSPHYKSFDVGVDGHNFYPWSWDEIVEKMNGVSENFTESKNAH